MWGREWCSGVGPTSKDGHTPRTTRGMRSSTRGARSLDGYLTEQENESDRSALQWLVRLRGITVLSSTYHASVAGSSLRAKAFAIAIRFGFQIDTTICRPERHVRCWQSSTQSISDARKGHCLFLAEFDHDSRVLLEPDTAKMLGLCDDLFRSRGRPKALCAVRLGVRGAKRCAGQLGGRARVQRGGDLSPTYLLGAALRMHAAIQRQRVQGDHAEVCVV